MRPHRWQPTRLPRPWDSPGKNTGVGCHFLLQCMKVKIESEVAQSCPTLSNPMDCSLPGSSVHGIFQARVLEWGAIAFSDELALMVLKLEKSSGCFTFLLYLYSALSLFCRLHQVSGTDAERISPQITQLLRQCNHQCLKQHWFWNFARFGQMQMIPTYLGVWISDYLTLCI